MLLILREVTVPRGRFTGRAATHTVRRHCNGVDTLKRSGLAQTRRGRGVWVRTGGNGARKEAKWQARNVDFVMEAQRESTPRGRAKPNRFQCL
jgi:hypothetical protein